MLSGKQEEAVAYLSLGSNQGDRLGYLACAVRRLAEAETQVVAVSSVYETAPQGKTDQPLFLNLAVKVRTERSPHDLLTQLQALESALERTRSVRWGPRTIDIDLLLHGAAHLQTATLELPHPRLLERAFVLVPLLEIAPELSLWERSLQSYLDALPDQGVSLFLAAHSFLERVRGVE